MFCFGENRFESLLYDISFFGNLKYFDVYGNYLWYLLFVLLFLGKLYYLNFVDNKFEYFLFLVCYIIFLRVF